LESIVYLLQKSCGRQKLSRHAIIKNHEFLAGMTVPLYMISTYLQQFFK